MANPGGHAGYSDLVWGLTASDNPWGYYAHEPQVARDNGTITPTAAISAMPYVPDESIATLKYFYFTFGPDLWGEFGFRDAFNLDQNWYATSYLAIDQGTQVPMIENYLTGLCWDMFMANPEITAMLDSIGFITGIEENQNPVVYEYKLMHNYPNPFNPVTTIDYQLMKGDQIELVVYDTQGQKVATLVDEYQKKGLHSISFSGQNLASGVYYYSLRSGNFVQTLKMVLIK